MERLPPTSLANKTAAASPTATSHAPQPCVSEHTTPSNRDGTERYVEARRPQPAGRGGASAVESPRTGTRRGRKKKLALLPASSTATTNARNFLHVEKDSTRLDWL